MILFSQTLFSAKEMSKCIRWAILYDETIKQKQLMEKVYLNFLLRVVQFQV